MLSHVADESVDYLLFFFVTAVLFDEIAHGFDPFCYVRIEKYVRVRL